MRRRECRAHPTGVYVREGGNERPTRLDTRPHTTAPSCPDRHREIGRNRAPRYRLTIPTPTPTDAAVAASAPEGAERAAPPVAVRLEHVEKRYGDVVAVAGIDLEIVDGEFFSMLGPSGSGKTTTLRMIAGFELPTAGRVELHGQDVTKLAPFERNVNTVFQDYALFPHMTVGENVAYGLMIRKVPRQERDRRVADALAMVRLAGYERRKPSQLSGGQRQRVALARALVNRPRVLLLDEPLGALDLKLREEMQIELKAIQREVGITFIYVTHDQEEALAMSDRMAVFNHGRIEQVGAPAESTSDPRPASWPGSWGPRISSPGTSPGRSSGTRGRSPSGRRRSASARPDDERRVPTRSPPWAHSGGRLPRTRHALHRGARRGRRAGGHAAEPRDVLDRGARGPGPGGPAHVGTAALPRHRRWVEARRRREQPTCETHDPGATARDRRRSPWRHAVAAGRRPRAPAPRRGQHRLARRARRSTCWPGRATSRTAAPIPRSTGSPTSRRQTRLRGHLPDLRDVGRGVQPVHHEPRAVRRRSPPRVTPACGSSGRATSSPSTSTSSRTTPTSSRPSRTSRTTRSTASTTASRTAAAPTC